MLSAEDNDRLTRVGPGTPMGKLMRCYWHPVATCHELAENPVKSVRILGETLTLFRDLKGRLGLVGQRCAHRGVDLKCGIPDEDGLHCPYHGWLYDRSGQCIDQPAEPADSRFTDRIRIPSYPVQELGGLVWAYLGEDPAPLLPRWDLFVVDNAFRQIGVVELNCNWLQCQENSVDTVHTEWAHGRMGLYALERLGKDDPMAADRFRRHQKPHAKIDFREVDVGIQKYRLREGDPEDSDGWTKGHPLVFPNYVRIGQPGYSEFQMRVPMDDTHTWHISYQVFFPGAVEVPVQDPVPAFDVPLKALPDFVLGQDLMCWTNQGEIFDRTSENLGKTDRGLAMFRRQLLDQIAVVEAGGDPINTFRDPAKNEYLDLALEDYGQITNYRRGQVKSMNLGDCSPVQDELDDLMWRGAEAARRQLESEGGGRKQG